MRLAVACPRTTAVTLATPDKAPRSQVCLGSGGHPGVVEFRQTADDAAMPPGGYLESTYPVLAAVRRDGAEGPRALLGARAEPVPPLLEPQATAVPGRASVRGTTSPGADVRVWIDGTLADEVTAGPDGRFATALDTGAGARSIQATAHAHGRSSLPGNVVLVVPQLAGALSAPVLDAPVSPTNSNPYAVTGTAAANSTVRLARQRHAFGLDAQRRRRPLQRTRRTVGRF
ncbi:MAG: hypothetical protein IPM75_15035 [Candidatus Competibacteraceae bacterium]|nr:hypothetical protein [Candidatus Competibacteraceae bacterium]